MSLVENYHVARKARLERLGTIPPKPRPVIPLKSKVEPYPYNAGWEGMWFYDLIAPKPHEKKQHSIRDIQTAVAFHYGIDLQDMLSDGRTWDLVVPRQVAMYLSKQLTIRSLPEIGRMFGKRDHTTILHGTRKIARKIQTDTALRDHVSEIRRGLA